MIRSYEHASFRHWCWLPIVAVLVGTGLLCAWAPDYLLGQGFPLDDAWIHAVYARELAQSGVLAYNPGIPATGETSPLWAVAIAWAHAVGPNVGVTVALTKVTGLALHLCTALLLGAALARKVSSRALAWGSAMLVALHPDLIAAAVSGMEVPLATAVVSAAIWACCTENRALLALTGALAVGARPETIVVCCAFPLLLHTTTMSGTKRGVEDSLTTLAGGVAALGGISLRNWFVSGLPLPATFYAKVHGTSLFDVRLQAMGFVELLRRIPLLNSPLVLVALFLLSVWALWRTEQAEVRLGAALFLSGVLFCSVSFALIPPIDPNAFYHQRYVLPCAPVLIAAMPLLLLGTLRLTPWGGRAKAEWIVVACLAAVLVAAAPARFRRLSNDARNIDDVQVAMGRALQMYSAADTAWVIDAGATRFFGRAFVVDMIGLNTPEILGRHAQQFLDRHPPRVLDVFPGWSGVNVPIGVHFDQHQFLATTTYTVTSAPWMRLHVLLTCEPPGTPGTMFVRGQSYPFHCSS